MKNFCKVFLAIGLVSLLLSSCGISSNLYAWQDYDNSIHTYTKEHTPQSEERIIKTYQTLINTPGGTRQAIQPGICAEYGFLLLKMGKKEQGLELLKKEIKLYPESSVFITRIIKQFEI